MTTPPATNFIDTFKQRFPEYASLTPETIATNLTKSLSGKSSSAFLNTFKQRFPEYSKLPNSKIISNLQTSIQNTKNTGGLASGDQAADLGLSIDDPKNYVGGKTTKSIVDFFTGATKKFAEIIGTSIAAPENVQKYSDALSQHNEVTQNLTKAIAQKKKLGQDTSTLQTALKQQMSDTPQISDFVDQTTLKRIQQTGVQNLEETLGLGAGTLLNMLAAPGGEAAVEGAVDTTKTLSSKILQGAKIGAGYGAASGASEAASEVDAPGEIAGKTVEGATEGAVVGAASEGTAGAINNMVKGRPILGSLAQVPDKTIPALNNVEDAEAIIREAQDMTKKNIANPDLPSASEVQGSQLHTSILNKSRDLLKQQGEKMGEILSNPIVGEAKADISNVVSDFEKVTKRGVQGLSRSQANDYTAFQNDLQDLKTLQSNGKLTVKQADDFLREWQPKVNIYKDTPLAKPINSTVNAINTLIKDTADKAETNAGIEGHPYRESNDEYHKLITNINDAESEVGTKNPGTGNFENSDKVYRQNATRDSSKAFKYLSGKTNIPLGQPAVLTKTIEDIYAKETPDNIIRDLHPSFSLPMTAIRSLRSFILKNEQDPDAIVEKMIQIVKDNNSKK